MKRLSLIKCPECGKEISDKAKMCVGCGFPLEEMIINENETIENSTNCFYCNANSFDEEGYCNACGMKRVSDAKVETVDINSEPYTICPKCGGYNKIGIYKCQNNKCGHKYTIGEYVVHENKQEEHTFNGVYRYLLGNKQEVYCPRCGSENCIHYQEQKSIPAKVKTRYTINLNPLRPFTFANKKEKVIRKETNYIEKKFLCNDCGHIFK